jgi:hypothetical protein
MKIRRAKKNHPEIKAGGPERLTEEGFSAPLGATPMALASRIAGYGLRRGAPARSRRGS